MEVLSYRAVVAPRAEFRYILCNRFGEVLMQPRPGQAAEFRKPEPGLEPLPFPSWMAAIRGRALRGLPHEIAIIQQEKVEDHA